MQEKENEIAPLERMSPHCYSANSMTSVDCQFRVCKTFFCLLYEDRVGNT